MASVLPGYRTVKDGSRRYDVTFRDANGKSRERAFRKHAMAVRFVNEVNTDKARGQFIDPSAGLVTFEAYATEWRSTRTTAVTSQEREEIYLRVHVFPVIGHLPLAKIKVSTIKALMKSMTRLAASTQNAVLRLVSQILTDAVEDEKIPKNVARSKSVVKPKSKRAPIVPLTSAQVAAFRDALPEQYEILAVIGAGLGLRQGESYGLSPHDVDWFHDTVTINRQVRQVSGSRLHFAAPKGGRDKGEKTRTIPLPRSVHDALAEYQARFPPVEVTLPWGDPDTGKPTTVLLFVTSRESKALNRNYVNSYIWKPALVAAGIEPTRDQMSHALRHHYVSVLLDAGETIVAIARWIGHTDPGFTLRTYAHLMEASTDRTKKAIDNAFASSTSPRAGSVLDGG